MGISEKRINNTLINTLGFEEDDYSIKDIENIFYEEIGKPADEIDFDLVYECIKTIGLLKNSKN